MTKKKPNKISETVHDSAIRLHRAGLIDAKTMAEFDALCLPSEKIKKAMNYVARDAISEMSDILDNMKKKKKL